MCLKTDVYSCTLIREVQLYDDLTVVVLRSIFRVIGPELLELGFIEASAKHNGSFSRKLSIVALTFD